MKKLHLTHKDFTTGTWSGGSTTQLYIYPTDGDYAARRFSLRISSAVVHIPESDFTPLEGVTRLITPLSGAFTLTHPGQTPVTMAPLDQPYRFSGGIPTHCAGTATDFNLMLKGVDGEMEVCRSRAQVLPGFNSYYPVEDTVLTFRGEETVMKAGELLVIFAEEAGALEISAGAVIRCFADIGDSASSMPQTAGA